MNIIEIYNKHKDRIRKKEYNIQGHTIIIDEDYQIDRISIIFIILSW